MSELRLPRPELRPEFRKRLRAQLMAEAVVLAEERRAHPWRVRLASWTVGALRPLLVTAVLAVMLLGGAGVAAAGALPGDLTYGLKQAAERVELALAFDEERKAEVLAAQAQRRLEELSRTASERPDKAPTASESYTDAVERFREAVEAVRQAEPADKREAVEELVDAAKAKHVPVLETLRERVPEAAQQGIDRALEEHKKLEAGKNAPGRPGSPGRSGDAPQGAEATASPTPSPSATATSEAAPASAPAATQRANPTPRGGGLPTSVPPRRP